MTKRQDGSIVSPDHPNPYVGPRTFTQAEGRYFFGREREARDLLSLVISQRLVLFYAQSGAGKSSLVNTRLIPQLRMEDFLVLPVGRVGGELPSGISQVENIYAYNLMLGLDQGNGDLTRFTHLQLIDFLNRLTTEDGEFWYFEDDIDADSAHEQATGEARPGETDPVSQPYVLIIDQFEEIITNHSDHWQERRPFFEQLEKAMQVDPALWVVLVLREDFVAALDPYAAAMTDKLRARFYMERMGVDSALQAVRCPAELGGRPFAPGVAEQLVDNLRQIQDASPGPSSPDERAEVAHAETDGRGSTLSATHLGQYLEPVQLQVVCFQLWENLRHLPPAPISFQNLDEAGNVDTALAAFYEDAIHAVLQDPDVNLTERELRAWFTDELITEAETRGTVYQGVHKTAGMPNLVVTLLSRKFLLRTELRAGGAWVELVHDRFVEPIVRSNRNWLERQSPLLRAAQRWSQSGRDAAILLSPQQLEALEADEEIDTTDPVIAGFVRASRANASVQRVQERMKQREAELAQARALARETEARRKAEEERAAEAEARQREQTKTARRLRLLTFFAAIMAILTAFSAYQVRQERDAAEDARQTAVAESTNAAQAQRAAIAERDGANAESTKAAQAQETALAERDSANIVKETAVVERNLAATAEQIAVEARATAVAERERAAAESTRAAAVRADAIVQLDERLTADARLQDAVQVTQPVVPLAVPTLPADASPTPNATTTSRALLATRNALAEEENAAATAAAKDRETATALAQLEATATATAGVAAARAATAIPSQIALKANPSVIAPGDCTYLLWQTRDVKEVYFEGEGKAGVGLSRECPEQTTTYRLRVVLQDGSENVKTVTVEVDPDSPLQETLPPRYELSATRNAIQSGECVYLIWQTRNVKEVYFQNEGVAGNDVKFECPTENTTYFLEIILPDGSRQSESVFISVAS